MKIIDIVGKNEYTVIGGGDFCSKAAGDYRTICLTLFNAKYNGEGCGLQHEGIPIPENQPNKHTLWEN